MKKSIVIDLDGPSPVVSFNVPEGQYVSMRERNLAIQSLKVQYNRYMRQVRKSLDAQAKPAEVIHVS